MENPLLFNYRTDLLQKVSFTCNLKTDYAKWEIEKMYKYILHRVIFPNPCPISYNWWSGKNYETPSSANARHTAYVP